jgi:UDP-N-acetylmuramoyl-L-alanyl-D-glutamate--2,6-diaminopimelate ligase
MSIALKDIVRSLKGARIIGDGNVQIDGIEYDSRRVLPGMLFIAVTGFKLNGNKFVPEAVRKGAVAVLTQEEINAGVPFVVVPELRSAMSGVSARFYGFPGRDLTIIGVTGTNGKSTSVSLIKNLLQASGDRAGMVNSLVYDTGKRQYKAERTTPESVDLQKYLSEMRDAGCSHGVVEVSSHALVLGRVENIDFKVGLFTNFSRDHLDFHKTMEEYLQAKKLFLRKLTDADRSAVINVDVPEFAGFCPDVRCRLITYSADGRAADVKVEKAELLADRTAFTLIIPNGRLPVTYYLPGRYNLSNAVGAAAVGAALGLEPESIARGLQSARAVPGRFEPIRAGQPFLVILDYAHTPDAIERLCLSAREITRGRLMILFGCGGDRDKGKRPLMGTAASEFSDFAVVTSDNPRTEEPLKIIDDIKPGLGDGNYVIIPDRKEAIMDIIKRAKENDTILIAGKGNEDYMEIGTEKYPFEDRKEIVRALKELGYQ